MLVFLLVLGALIFVHELGHFLVAKFNRVGVLEFALGFGPKLFSFTLSETTYSLRIIPLGGFVRMVGDDPTDVEQGNREGALPAASGASPIEGAQENLTAVQQEMLKDPSRWFLNKKYWPKMAIVLAGPVANLIFAWVLATGFYAIRGVPVPLEEEAIIGDTIPGQPGAKAGFKAWDRVVSVEGKEVKDWKALVTEVGRSDGKEIEFQIDRPKGAETLAEGVAPTFEGAERLTIRAAPVEDMVGLDLHEGKDGKAKSFKIGLIVASRYEKVGALEAAGIAGLKVWEISSGIGKMLKALVTRAVSPSKVIGGPIEIFRQTARSAEKGIGALLWTVIVLNVTLGVMNLLPIPVLDGGHLVMFTMEGVRGRPLSLRFREIATQVGMCVLLLLMVFAIGNDIVRIFT